MRAKISPTYFVWTNPLITGLIAFGLFYPLPVGLVAPHLLVNIPVFTAWYLRLLETHSTQLYFLFTISVYVHIAEALLAMAICNRHGLTRTTTMKWMASVFLNGVFSLFYLIKPTSVLKGKPH
uniref:Transmembrane protein 254 n=1 Tax=Pseudodiaptomus poplesia TaxID=213370 RepID=A0A0U2UTA8_9MAXI|nr:hypothetical protein [Pseudodiaptomus poplesia]